MEHEITFLFYALLLLVAFLYASVGHGGASGYLALMALYEFTPDVMRPTALLLNIFVSGIAFLAYFKSGSFLWKLFLPLAITAVPAAYIGGFITPPTILYKQLLGAFLLIPAIRFILPLEAKDVQQNELNLYLALLMGAGIGLISGILGIGGGIILSPILILLGWSNVRQAAAVSALFILVNSISGLAGQMQQGISFSQDMVLMVGIALVGGLCGSYFGAFRFNQKTLKISLSVVLFIASLKLLFS
ncbi:MAG: sulfite exporter TauE/SafE family protein [Saprospiraceae bacterium]|nr:sulfite exporter TauE/SafE family protein [Saprospiraceae bacterium]